MSLRLWRRTVAILFLSSVVLAPGVSGADTGDVRAQVQAMLDRRTKALTDGDEQSWMSSVDEKATPEFRSQQKKFFEGWHSMPLAKFHLAVVTSGTADVAKALGDKIERGADESYLPETILDYRIAGYNDQDAADSLSWTYTKRNGKWYVAANDDGRPLGLDPTHELWDDGAVSIKRTEHFLVIAKPDQTARADTLSVYAESAMATFLQRWPLAWSAHIPLIVPGNDKEAALLLRTTVDVANFAAFVSYSPVREPQWTNTPPRIFVQDTNLAKTTPARQTDTIVHELTHAATAGITGPSTPTWLQEGLAEWIRRDKATDIAPPAGTTALPNGSVFATTSGSELTSAYDAAASAMAYLAKRFGPDAPVKLFQAVGASRDVPGSPSYMVNAAFESSFGLGIEQFQTEWLGGAR